MHLHDTLTPVGEVMLATVAAGAVLSMALPGRGDLLDALVPAVLFGLAWPPPARYAGVAGRSAGTADH